MDEDDNEVKVKAFESAPAVPSGLTTERATVPAACGGVVAFSCVELTKETAVAGVPPKETVAPLAKFEPVITTAVPPEVDPEFGETPLTVISAEVYVNARGSELELPFESDTTMLTVPAACGGTIALNWTELTTVTWGDWTPPKLTESCFGCELLVKFEPLMVTVVPPTVGPVSGTIEAIDIEEPCVVALVESIIPPPHAPNITGRTATNNTTRGAVIPLFGFLRDTIKLSPEMPETLAAFQRQSTPRIM
jgi:hypothetical protein